jgi:hypothetical protein
MKEGRKEGRSDQRKRAEQTSSAEFVAAKVQPQLTAISITGFNAMIAEMFFVTEKPGILLRKYSQQHLQS